MMNYRSIEDLNRCVVSNLGKVPMETDLIVGIPRSGLLVANLMALHLNLPFTDLEGFVNERIFQSGTRMKDYLKPFADYKRVVVVDDSIYSGKSMAQVQEKLRGLYPDKVIQYAAVYAVPSATSQVDFYLEICKWPRIFEWNMMHNKFLGKCCVDIDGVLCKDPTQEENDDGENYKTFLLNAQTLLRPSQSIGYLVTNRLEKYRNHTEAWLAKNNIAYQHLIMSDLPTKEARLKANNHGGFKASVYMKSDCWLFIESSEWQAQQIAALSGKPVYCVDARRMIYPNRLAQAQGRLHQLARKVIKQLSLQ